MIWRSVIFFSLLLAALPISRGATVTGSVEVIDSGSRNRPSDLSGIVVWLESLRGPVPTTPRLERMLQKGKSFSPHVLAITLGSTVEFPNADPIFHNAFSNFNGQIFDIGLYPPGKSRSVVFRRPGVVRVFCNIHPSMSAVVVVMDTPYFGITGRHGHYTLADVPPGAYRRRIFYERATAEALADLTQEVEVGSVAIALPVARISEAGYIPMPHADKHGQPYPRGAGEAGYSVPQ